MAILPLSDGQKEIVPEIKNKKDEKHIGIIKLPTPNKKVGNK